MFVFIVELQLKKQIDYIRKDLEDLLEKINKNKKNILDNREHINHIEENSKKIHTLEKDDSTAIQS
jgi:predicted  nucleic acid-binding Zn-ribbon protein